jgi:hypothetical protein
MFSFSTNSCILVRATAGATLHRPAGEHVVALLEIKRQPLLHLDAAGRERAGLHGEKADLHRGALRAQDRGRGDECAGPEHAGQDGSAMDAHMFTSSLGSARWMGFPHRSSAPWPSVIFAYRAKLVPRLRRRRRAVGD